MSTSGLRRREPQLADRIPYTAFVSDAVIRTIEGDYLQCFRIGGAPFESADDAELNGRHERLNALLRNLASPQVALWTHLIRRRAEPQWPAAATTGFAAQLDQRYRHRLAGESLMVNDLYLSLVYRPPVGQRRAQAKTTSQAVALEACAQLAGLVEATLSAWRPERLTLRADGAGPLRAPALEFLSTLIDGHTICLRVPRTPLNEALGTSRLLFGRELIEVRSATTTQFGAMLGIKEYPTGTQPGLLDPLLTLPFPLILTQSFACLSRAGAQGLLQRQIARLANAGDFALSQAEALHEALDDLSGNHFVMGDHHFSLQVQSDPVPSETSPAAALDALRERIDAARAVLAEAGMTVAREDLALEPAFWAQLPGHFPMRPRRAPITSRNFVALSPFNNHPGGRARGNPWGEALTILKSAAGSPYYFSMHARDKDTPEGEGGNEAGHTFICGPTGAGKTVLIGFLITMLTRQSVTQVIFDKDRGLEILTRALGGTYLTLRSGEPTGCNPLALDPTPANLEFLRDWLRTLMPGTPLSAREAAQLDQALTGTLALAPEARTLSRLLEFLDPTSTDGAWARLSPWCQSQSGPLAWAFDAAPDRMGAVFGSGSLLGIDVTEFLDNAAVRAPLTLYLFHRVRSLLDGRRLACWCDEFWRLLEDPAFEHFAKDAPKTWRKLNALLCLSTQSPSDVLASPISRTIIEQTPTKIFLPNPEAASLDYAEGFGLTEREVRLIAVEMAPASRRFLLRQGRHSLVCELDLKGFTGELAVIASRAQTLAIVHRLIAECGPAPEHWVPALMREVTGRPTANLSLPTP